MLASSAVRRLALTSGLALLALLVIAQVASAATLVQDSPNHFVYTAAAGDFNSVTVSYNGTDTFSLIDDGAASIDVSGTALRCSAPDNTVPNDVACTGTVSGLFADLGDQDDYLDGSQANLPLNVTGGTGFDSISGGPQGDTLAGGDNSDYLDGAGGSDTLTGGAGSDELDDGLGSGDNLDGGADDDYFYTGSSNDGSDTFNGGTGADEIDYSARGSAVTVDLMTSHLGGQSGENDAISNVENVDGSSTASSTLTGDDNANYLYGGNLADTLTGNGGNDILYADKGNDVLSGGDGNDELSGGLDGDLLSGGANDDFLIGGDNGDTISGDAGDDEIDPGTHYTGATPGSDGSDVVNGGDGLDWVDYYDRSAPLTLDLSGSDTLTPTTTNGQSGENDSLINVENVNAGGGADAITGNSGPNIVYDWGGAGDTINTLGGDDTIDMRDDAVDTANCGDGSDRIFADVVGVFGGTVNDNIAGCETVNSDYTPPVPVPASTPAATTGTTTSTSASTPAPVVTPAPVFTVGAIMAKIQLSPKANRVFGTATIASDGSNLEVLVFKGKPSKKTQVGKLVKKGLEKGVLPFQVALNKKASKAAAGKKKGVPMTVKVTITPSSGKAFVKTFKVTVKKGTAPACFRVARVRAHTAC